MAVPVHGEDEWGARCAEGGLADDQTQGTHSHLEDKTYPENLLQIWKKR